MSFAAMMLVAIACDLAFGWPAKVFATIGHPVTWLGRLIKTLDQRLNRDGDSDQIRRLAGVLAMLVTVGGTGLIAALLQSLLPQGGLGILIGGVLAWPLVALRSMHDHVVAVAKPLSNKDLPAARYAVSMIVGRDPSVLDEAGVARAAIESLAENTSDGIVAPLFWGVVFGLPGIAAYKAINTLDSMIGHRTARFECFGWASARLDDLVNLIPARLTGALFAICSKSPRQAFRVMLRDAPKHRSPNAGWPEAAMAAGLGIRVSGPRVYANRVAEEPWVNAAAPDPQALDLQRGLALYRRAMILMGVGLLVLTLGG